MKILSILHRKKTMSTVYNASVLFCRTSISLLSKRKVKHPQEGAVVNRDPQTLCPIPHHRPIMHSTYITAQYTFYQLVYNKLKLQTICQTCFHLLRGPLPQPFPFCNALWENSSHQHHTHIKINTFSRNKEINIINLKSVSLGPVYVFMLFITF